jgi:hypothetical protein
LAKRQCRRGLPRLQPGRLFHRRFWPVYWPPAISKDLYSRAKTSEEKVKVLKEWHPKGYVNLDPIKNLEEYFKYVRLATCDSTWFRGESMDHGHLIPKLYRNIDDDKIAEQHKIERTYYYEFQRRSRALAAAIHPDDIWSWYFLMQHYGGPTRLLDWTQDAGIALFFSLDTDRDSMENPIVTVLQPTVLVHYAFKELGEDESFRGLVLYPGEAPTERWITNITGKNDQLIGIMPDSPIALLPPYFDPRITAQRSCFTLFGKHMYAFYKNDKHITCPCCDQKIILKLVIEGQEKNALRKELARIGITNGRVYPGLVGISKELSEEIYRT